MKKSKWHKVNDGHWINFEHVVALNYAPTGGSMRLVARMPSGEEIWLNVVESAEEAEAHIKELMRRYGD